MDGSGALLVWVCFKIRELKISNRCFFWADPVWRLSIFAAPFQDMRQNLSRVRRLPGLPMWARLRHKTCCGWWLNPHIPSSGRIICGPHQGTRFGSSYSHKDGNENFLGWTERFWFVIHEHCSKNLLWFHSTGCPLEHLSHVQRWLVDCWLVFH